MDDKRIYLLAQFDKDAQQKYAGIYEKLVRAGLTGEQTPDIPYHLTLGSVALGCKDRLLERIQSVCQNTKAFDISLNHMGLFGQRVLFIAPSMYRHR